MKKFDFTYLSKWLPVVTMTSVGWAFFGTFSLVAFRMITDNVRLQSTLAYLLGTLIVCAVAGKLLWDMGIDMNNKRKPYPSDIPMMNLFLGALIFWGAYIVFEIQPFVPPLSAYLDVFVIFMADMFGNGLTVETDAGTLQNIGTSAGFGFLQTFIYAAVSAVCYLLAKDRQDNHNEVVRKLREEDAKETKEENDPIAAALKNGLGNRK